MLLAAAALVTLAQAALFAQNAPSDLVAVSATRSQVQLQWKSNDASATGYRVERRPLSAGDGVDFALAVELTTGAAATTAVDRAIDPYETYRYRIVAVRGSQDRSGPSNEVVVGPPPVGFNVPVPVGAFADPRYFAMELRMALDANGDPAISWVRDDQLGDNNGAGATIYFLSWNRAQYRWNDVARVGLCGTDSIARSNNHLSMARDASTNVWAIAHETYTAGGDQKIEVHYSTDNGVTWKGRTLASDTVNGQHPPVLPSIGMAKGILHAVWFAPYDGVRYASGRIEDAASPFNSVLLPLLPQATEAFRVSSLAMDASGVPGVVTIQSDMNQTYNLQVGYWRPGQTSQLKVMDTQNYQTDDPAVTLAYFNNAPRLVTAMRRTEDYYERYDRQLWFTAGASDGNGSSWSSPVPLPSDGERTMDPQLSLTFGPNGAPVVAAESNGGTGANVQCSAPLIVRGSADLAQWSTCAVQMKLDSEPVIGFPNVAAMDNGKLYVAFYTSAAGSAAPDAGVVLWREP